MSSLSNGNCGLEEGTVYTDILNSFNRIAAHCASAMVALLKSGDENPDMHIHDSKIYKNDPACWLVSLHTPERIQKIIPTILHAQ